MMILIIGFTCPPTIHFKFITKCDSVFITKCDNFITKCDRTYVLFGALQVLNGSVKTLPHRLLVDMVIYKITKVVRVL